MTALSYPTAEAMRGQRLAGGGPANGLTVAERLGRSFVETPAGCWLWTRGLTTAGYGHLSVGNRHYQAHRLMYVLHVGPVDDVLQLDHLCRTRRCVNPAHLEPVSPRENVRRGAGTRLTPAIARAIRESYRPFDRAASLRVVARRFGVDHSTVLRALRDDRPPVDLIA